MTRFDGADYDHVYDNDRLTGQIKRVFECMKDGTWRTLGEIEARTCDGEASISAQLRNLRKERFGAYRVERRRRGQASAGCYEYRLLAPIPEGQMKLEIRA